MPDMLGGAWHKAVSRDDLPPGVTLPTWCHWSHMATEPGNAADPDRGTVSVRHTPGEKT